MNEKELHLDSLVIHAGQSPDAGTGAVMPPISMASTYAQASPGEHKGYVYARGHNPTRQALERCIGRLESSGLDDDPTFGGFAFASGMAATATLLDMIEAGSHIVAMDDMYGGTYRLMTRVREKSQGLHIDYVDLTDPKAIENAVTDATRMIWVETPTNPQLKLVDLAAVAAVGRSRGIMTVCDNTFATPLLQRPLELGIDVVLHSATKYLGGHSDVIAGLLVTSRQNLADEIRFVQNSAGGILGPVESYMTLRGIKTLALRMRQHCAGAARIAAFLEAHPKVARVAYPCLDSHPQHDLAVRQMQLDGQGVGGGMVTIWLKGDLESSRRFLESVEVFTLAESLGGVESLIEHPAIMTHASVPKATREALGVDDTLVRISVGIENVEDLEKDLERALGKV